jgi:hypothetical protein
MRLERSSSVVVKARNVCYQTERRGRVVNTLSSHSKDPGFKSRPEDCPGGVFCGFPLTLEANVGLVALKLGHDLFFSRPFQFIIHLSLHSMLYSLSH